MQRLDFVGKLLISISMILNIWLLLGMLVYYIDNPLAEFFSIAIFGFLFHAFIAGMIYGVQTKK